MDGLYFPLSHVVHLRLKHKLELLMIIHFREWWNISFCCVVFLPKLSETPWRWSEPTYWTWPSWVLKGWLSRLWALDERWTQTTHLCSSSLLLWSTASSMVSKVKASGIAVCQLFVSSLPQICPTPLCKCLFPSCLSSEEVLSGLQQVSVGSSGTGGETVSWSSRDLSLCTRSAWAQVRGPFKFTHVLTCNISLQNAGGTRSNIRTAHAKPELQKGNSQPDFSLFIISFSFLFLSADVRTYTGTFLKLSNVCS